MKWGRQELEEEMDDHQEVELLGSKGISDLGFMHIKTWSLKYQHRRISSYPTRAFRYIYIYIFF